MTQKGETASATRALLRERAAELAKRYEAGESAPSLAAELGVSTGALTGALKRRGVTIRPKAPYISPEKSASIQAGYEAGQSMEQLAESQGISRHLVRRALSEAGVRTRRRGGFSAVAPRGPKNRAWKGGRHLNREGYVLVWLDPEDPLAAMATSRGYVFEHRLVVARDLGRPLTKVETVHHVNGNREDNRLENLQLRRRAHGPGAKYQCQACGSTDIAPVVL